MKEILCYCTLDNQNMTSVLEGGVPEKRKNPLRKSELNMTFHYFRTLILRKTIW